MIGLDEMNLSALQAAGADAHNLPFGVSADATARLLRELSDKVASGEICIQSARVVGFTTADDYTRTSLRLVFVERQPERA